MSNIESLQNEIAELSNKLETERLSAGEKQVILDQISEKKREIEATSKEESMIVPIINAPIIAERKATRASIFMGTKVIL